MSEEDTLANAFYDEDYLFIKFVTGKRPKDQPDAENIIENYLKHPRGRK